MSRLSLILAFICCASMAQAAEVFINGVKVTGAIRNQTFDKVEARFDAKGDLHIKAPGVRIEGADGQPAAPAAPAKPKDEYWFILNAKERGHYKTLVSVNGEAIITVPGKSSQYIKELGGKLRAGQNEIKITFLPIPGAPATAGEKEALDVMIGVGDQSSGTLTIRKVLGSVKHPTGRAGAEAHTINVEL